MHKTCEKLKVRGKSQPRIDLAAAIEAQRDRVRASPDLTFTELCRAYVAAHFDGADMQLRKWIAALGDKSAWEVTAQELAIAGEAMLDVGYSPATVNRNISQLGSVYRWAKRKMLTPVGFVSPTLSQHRYEEAIRRVQFTDAEAKRLVDASAMVKDRRFMVLVRLLMESGARRSEITNRIWADINLDERTIEVISTKTGVPRMLFFSAETASLMRRVWPTRHPSSMPFESKRAPGATVNFKKNWTTVTQAIGRPDLHMHDLRHHRAKQLLTSGVTAAVAGQALGHSSQILQRRYGHLENATIRQAVETSWT